MGRRPLERRRCFNCKRVTDHTYSIRRGKSEYSMWGGDQRRESVLWTCSDCGAYEEESV